MSIKEEGDLFNMSSVLTIINILKSVSKEDENLVVTCGRLKDAAIGYDTLCRILEEQLINHENIFMCIQRVIRERDSYKACLTLASKDTRRIKYIKYLLVEYAQGKTNALTTLELIDKQLDEGGIISPRPTSKPKMHHYFISYEYRDLSCRKQGFMVEKVMEKYNGYNIVTLIETINLADLQIRSINYLGEFPE